MKEFGGYFEYIKNNGREYHNPTLKLDSARHAFKYLLQVREYKKIYIPYYICDSIINQIKNLELEYEFYSIDKDLIPIFSEDFILKNGEAILIVNYFGMYSDDYLKNIIDKYEKVIIDNTQDFFRKPLQNMDTIYSCRKFFPVVEGGYLYTTAEVDERYISQEKNLTFKKLEYLFKKFELDSNSAYLDYSLVEEEFEKNHLKKMSNLTENFLKGFDYESHKLKRERNFMYFHNFFKDINALDIKVDEVNGPMFYPLLLNKNLKNKLIENKIYIPTLWREVLNVANENSFEKTLVENLHPIPVDFRWEIEDLKRVKDKILELIEGG